MPDADAAHGQPRPSRAEWLGLAGLVMLAAVVRAWHLGAVGLNHFDEAAYAFSGLGISDPSQPLRLFPSQVRFAPPVYFLLVGLGNLIARQPSEFSAIVINVVLGTASVPVVWLAGRRWFGPGAGMVAASFLALNEFHIGLSRAALTDVTFAMVFMLALLALTEALATDSPRRAIVAGLLVGLAWNTKYHGWFVVVAAALGMGLRWLRGPRTLTSAHRPLILLTTTSVVAIACYIPWALFVQSGPGGYAALSAYQSTLLSLHWVSNAVMQARMQWYMEGLLSRLAPCLAVVAVAVVTGTWASWNGSTWRRMAAVAVGGAIAGSAATALALTLVSLPQLIRRSDDDVRSAMLLGWVGLFVVMTPAYHPYARLLLPLTLATMIGAGVSLQAAVGTRDERDQGGAAPWLWTAGVLAVTVGIAVAVTRSEPSLWRPSRTMADAASGIASMVTGDEPVLVLGEPQVGFYLRLDGKHVLVGQDAVAALRNLSAPAYIVTGTYATRTPVLKETLARLRDQLSAVATYQLRPNDLRLLDDMAPDRARAYRLQPDGSFDLTLLRFEPAARP